MTRAVLLGLAMRRRRRCRHDGAGTGKQDMNRELRIGVAMGGGGAAALSYIGVLEQLLEANIDIHCIAGTSAGAIVGAALAAGHLHELGEVMTSLTRGRYLSLFDLI